MQTCTHAYIRVNICEPTDIVACLNAGITDTYNVVDERALPLVHKRVCNTHVRTQLAYVHALSPAAFNVAVIHVHTCCWFAVI